MNSKQLNQKFQILSIRSMFTFLSVIMTLGFDLFYFGYLAWEYIYIYIYIYMSSYLPKIYIFMSMHYDPLRVCGGLQQGM
jgi:hypothetical protein